MKIYILPLLCLVLVQTVNAQTRPGDPGYSPLPAKIVLEDFKSSTKQKKKNKLTISELQNTTPSEVLSIYANYEMDSAGVFDKKGNFVSIDSKFMDLYLVYEYKYRLDSRAILNINDLLPNVLKNKGDKLVNVSLTSHSSNKEKIKSKKIRKKYYQYYENKDHVSIDLDESQLIGDFFDIKLFVKSRNFMHIEPILTDGEYFSRQVEFSIPAFLHYSFPEASEGYKLVSTSESSFKVLELNRGSRNYDDVTKEIGIPVLNKSWVITPNYSPIKSFEFSGYDTSFKIDMGFKMIDILKY